MRGTPLIFFSLGTAADAKVLRMLRVRLSRSYIKRRESEPCANRSNTSMWQTRVLHGDDFQDS